MVKPEAYVYDDRWCQTGHPGEILLGETAVPPTGAAKPAITADGDATKVIRKFMTAFKKSKHEARGPATASPHANKKTPLLYNQRRGFHSAFHSFHKNFRIRD